MGQKGKVYVVPKELVESWWIPLREAGFDFKIVPPLTDDVPVEFDGCSYRKGIVRRGRAIVQVLPTPGQHPLTNGPLIGKFLIILSARFESDPDACQLECEISKVLCQKGAQLISIPKKVNEQ